MLTEFSDILLDKDDTIVGTATQPTTDAVIIAFSDQTVRIFGQNANGKLQRLGPKVAQDILPTPKKITSVCCHPFIPYFTVIGMEEGKVIIWDAQNARHVSRDELMSSDVTQCCWLAHGRVLGLADAVGRVVLSAYDPQTSEFRTVQKVQRQGKVVRMVERTACTQNFYLNLANADPEADKIYPHIGEGPLEIIVAWDKGDVIDIQDVQKVSLICSVPQGVYELLYVPELDSGCAISPQGDLITFGFESTAWRAKRQILNKTKIEFSTSGGICGIGGGRLAFVSSTMAQVKIYDIIQQQATAIDLDEQIDGFHGVTGSMQFVSGVGLLVPLSKQATFAVISDVNSVKSQDGQMQLRYEPIEQNSSYVSMLDRQLAEGSVGGQVAKSQFVVKEVLQLDNFNPSADVYFQTVQNDGDLCDKQSILASNKQFRGGITAGSGLQYTVISFKPPVFGSGNLQNQVLLQQQLSSESTTSPQFLQKNFNDGLKNNITALQTGGRAIRVCISTPAGRTEECNIGVKHGISKIIVGQALGAAKAAYVLVQGGNSFSVFEVGEGLLPNALEQFQLPENQFQVIDCCLFGKYIIAAVRVVQDAGSQGSVEYQILKLTFAGKSSASLVIQRQQGHRDVDISAISSCNQHLFMWTTNSSLYYIDLRSFDKYTLICRLTKDYLFSEKAQVKIQMASADDAIGEVGKDGPTICMGITLGSTFSLGTIQVNTVQCALCVESPQNVLVAITYKGFNDVVQRYLELPCVTVLKISTADLTALVSGLGASNGPSGQQGEQDSAQHQSAAINAVNQCRTFDFTPGRVRLASIDSFGTLSCEVEANDLYKYLLLQFSSFTIQRFGLWNRALILYDNSALIKSLISKETDFAEDEAEASGDPRAEGLTMQTFLRFLSVRVGPEHRRLIARKDVFLKVRKDVVVVQGLFAPNLKPEVETHELQAAGFLIQVVSPALIVVKRTSGRQKNQMSSGNASGMASGGYSGGSSGAQGNQSTSLKPSQASEVVSVMSSTGIKSLFGRSGRGVSGSPLQQNARVTFALSRFVVSVRNNRFEDAYSAVEGSDSVEIWRSLAGLCVQNGYVELLRTCISHIKCPAVSLLLRSYGGHSVSAESVKSADGNGNSGNAITGRQGGQSGDSDKELAAVLAVGLGELPSGLHLVHRRPLQYAKLLRMSGLGIYAIQNGQEGSDGQSGGQSGQNALKSGLQTITRKSAIYQLAGRCAALGDAAGANACYTELFGVGGGELNQESDWQSRKAQATASRVREEVESNGVEAGANLARQLDEKAGYYEAAVRLEAAGAEQHKSSYTLEAAKLFLRAKCFRRALDCAIEVGDDEVVYTIAVSSPGTQLALTAAGYFAKKAGPSLSMRRGASVEGEDELYAPESDGPEPLERALVLYSSAGFAGQAVDLCIQTNRLKELAGIVSDALNELEQERREKLAGGDTQPQSHQNNNQNNNQARQKKDLSTETLARAGYELIQAKESSWALDDYQKFIKVGVLALAYGGATDQALYCISQNVISITAEMADLLTPEDLSVEENQQTVLTIGKLLFKAGLYQAAVKKFISVGNSFLALQALIKLGDVNKVIRFAQMARSKECMKAAANFLQTCNFRDEPQILQTIVTFYQKAGAEEALVRFFVQCAREEIDVFNDYEKAIDALREAAKWIGRVIQKIQSEEQGDDNQQNSQVLQQLEEQKHIIEQNGKLINGFLHLIEYARNNLNAVDAADAMSANSKKLLQAVVEQPGALVKVEHILAFLAEFHAQRGESQRVVNILTNMKQKGMDVAKYVQDDVLRNYGEQAGIEGSALVEENAGVVVEDIGYGGDTGGGYGGVDGDAPDVQTGDGNAGDSGAIQVNDNMDDLDINLD